MGASTATLLGRRQALKGLLAFAASGLVLPAVASSGTETYRYLLGDAVVTIQSYHSGSGPTFVCPHDNENTAVSAAQRVVASHGGRIVQLMHGGERNITFHLNGTKYVFDPNRMFTNRGIEASLKMLGGTYSREARQKIADFADVFMLHFNAPRSARIVAIHNNTNGAYSVQSYLPGGDLAHEAREVHVNPNLDPDDFFFVTTTGLFSALKQKGYNVVLQSRRVTDDGSLSVYAAMKGIPYVNVEAQSGHQTIQRRMLEALF